MRYLIADTETTNADGTAEIIEVAFEEVDENLNLLGSDQILIRPTGPISPGASAAHGLVAKDLAAEPLIADAMGSLTARSGPFDDVCLIAHNAQFDARLLKPWWRLARTCCTLRGARKFFPDSPDHKLQTLKYYLELEVPHGAHRAADDVATVRRLLEKLMAATGVETLPELMVRIDEPIIYTKMPFGKFRDKPLNLLPASYVNWLLSLPDLEQDLRRCLECRKK